MMTLPEIMSSVSARSVKYVTVTGGEPLAQPDCLSLLRLLCDTGYAVSLETSGALAIEGIDERVSVVLDLKTPGSGECSRNRYDNMAVLKFTDQVKFVICDRADYEWARFKLEEFDLTKRVDEILFSASHDQLDSAQLADWILEDELPVRLQVQLHKLLWGDRPGV